METRLGRFCDRLIEAGWLLAIAVIPIFFDVRTSRVFEPDKSALLRGIAFAMAAAWLVMVLERAFYRVGRRLGWIEWTETACPRRSRLFYTSVILAALYAVVYIASTFTSVLPRISLMGSYQRAQGTLFTLSLIVIALLVATHLRTRDQVARLLGAVALGSLPVTLYALMQRGRLDPLPWGSDVASRATSTMGNPIFLGGYLVMAIPLTFAGLIALIPAARNAHRPGEATSDRLRFLQVAGYIGLLLCGLPILILQVVALAVTASRGPLLALLAIAVPTLILLVAVPLRKTSWRWIPIGLTGLLTLGILAMLIVVSFVPVSLTTGPLALATDPAQSPTGTVRQLIWEGSRQLIYTRPAPGGQPDRWTSLRPLLGYGPETMYSTYHQVYQPQLGRYESRSASPDRAYNQLLDIGVNLGWAGTLVFLLLLAAFFVGAIANVATARSAVEVVAAVGIFGAGLAHFVEAQFGIPTVSTQLLFWIGLGTTVALLSRREAETLEKARAVLPGRSLASGVAIFFAPATALVALMLSGFLRVPSDGIGPAMIALIGLVLTMVVALVNVTVAWREPETLPRYWQWLYPALAGGLAVLALVLLAAAGATANALMVSLNQPALGQPELSDVVQQTQALPLVTWGAILLGLTSVALSLPRPQARLVTWSSRNLVAFLAALPIYAPIAAGAALLVMSVSVRPILADAFFKLAALYDRQRMWETGVSLHEQAVAQNPAEDFYFLWLGYARLEQARQASDPARRATFAAQSLEALERARALNPLDPDHTANLARYHQTMLQIQTDAAARETSARAASGFYAQAVVLAPSNVVLWNEWAVLQREALRDNAEACRLLDHSLELEPTFEQTRTLAASCS